MKKAIIILLVILIGVGIYIIANQNGTGNNLQESTFSPTAVPVTQDQLPTKQIPQKVTSQTLTATSDEKRQCASDGLAYFTQFKSDQLTTAQGLHETETVDDPQYHYNSVMQTCLVSLSYTIFGFAGSNDEMFVSQIRDVYTNKIIITGTWSLNGTFHANLTQPEYTQKSKVLMSQ